MRPTWTPEQILADKVLSPVSHSPLGVAIETFQIGMLSHQ